MKVEVIKRSKEESIVTYNFEFGFAAGGRQIKRSKEESIVTYSVPDLSILDFQGWKDKNEPIGIPLNKLKDTVDNLDSKDPETGEPVSDPREVDFYLPDLLKNRVISRLAKSQTDTEEEVTKKISIPPLRSSVILSAVVVEILQNHLPPSDYKVRISDG